MELKHNIVKFYWNSFIYSLLFHVPVFILYWNQYLTLTQIMFMYVAFFGLGILLEVPSGVFADIYGRKTALIVGKACYAIALIGFVFAPKLSTIFGSFFLWFFLLECLAGVGYTFNSGADTAFLYDTLKKLKRISEFKRIRGNSTSLTFVGLATATFFGSLIAQHGLEKPYFFSALFIFISIIIVAVFKEPTHYKKLGVKHYWQHQKESLIFALTHKRVRWLSFYYGLMFSLCLMGLATFFQLYLRHIGVPIRHFSFIYPAAILFGALASNKAHKVESWLGEKLTLHLLPPLLAATFLLMYLFDFYWAFFLLFIIEGVYGFITPILDHYVHVHIPSKQRATIISIRNLFAGVFLVIFAPAVGWVGDSFGLVNAFLTAGIITFVLGILLFLTEKKSRIV